MKNKKQNLEPEYIPEEDEDTAVSYVKKAKDKLKIAEKERREYLDGWQRERADFANFKRDMGKYLEETKTSVKEDMLTQFLNVLDNIELTIKHAPKEISKSDWYKGLEQVYKQYLATLEEVGAEEIKVKEGDKFDPMYHEAIEGSGEKISEVLQKGYTMGEKILRPAKVKVNKK